METHSSHHSQPLYVCPFLAFISPADVLSLLPPHRISFSVSVPCSLSHALLLSHPWHWPLVRVLSPFGRVQLFTTLWAAAHQAPLSMGFSRQERCLGLACSPLGDLPNPGIEPASPASPALAGGFFTTSATWEALTAGGVHLIYSFTPYVQASRLGFQQCQYFPQDYILTFHHQARVEKRKFIIKHITGYNIMSS